MAKVTKSQSSPISTGSGGTYFETRVQALFATLMLTNNTVPSLLRWPITKILLQARYAGYYTDDFVVIAKDSQTNREAKLLAQVKRIISITNGDKTFGEVVQAAWNDFNNPHIFSPEIDSFALITGPLTAADTNNVGTLLDWARSSNDENEFLLKVDKEGFSNDEKRAKLSVFKTHLQAAANDGGEISNIKLWKFLKCFHLIGCDIDSEEGLTINLLYGLISRSSTNDPTFVWSKIVDEVQSFNKKAGTISLTTFSEEVQQIFNIRKNSHQVPDLRKLQDYNNETSLDEAADVIVTCLHCIPRGEQKRCELIKRIMYSCNIEIAPWLLKEDVYLSLAMAMLNLGLCKSIPILGRLCAHQIGSHNIEYIFDFLKLTWVDSHAADSISKCVLHVEYEPKPAIVLNASEFSSAKMYIRRAMNRPPLGWHIYQLSNIHGGNPRDDIVTEVKGLLTIELLGTNCNNKKTLNEELIRLNKANTPVFVILIYSKIIARLLPTLQKIFPLVTFFLLTGEIILKEEDLKGASFKFLYPPLEPNVENIALSEICDAFKDLIRLKCFGKDSENVEECY